MNTRKLYSIGYYRGPYRPLETGWRAADEHRDLITGEIGKFESFGVVEFATYKQSKKWFRATARPRGVTLSLVRRIARELQRNTILCKDPEPEEPHAP